MKILKLFLMLLCGSFFITSCSDDDAKLADQDVPSSVWQSFHRLYKDVDDVQWEKVDAYHVARFNGSALSRTKKSYTTAAWFTEEGDHLQSNQDIDFDVIPSTVKDAFKAYKQRLYSDWETDDCEIVVRSNMSLIYIIEIEKGNLERKISISIHGDILKDILDDNDDILPVLIPNEIYKVLKNLFPSTYESILLLEFEIDDSEFELDILEDGQHKEIKLDAQYNWLETSYEVTLIGAMEILPSAIVEKLVALAKQMGFDLYDPLFQKCIEIKVHDHVSNGWYMKLEIEVGDLELEVIINKNGDIKIDD